MNSIKRILIANRGEIAVRIIRACKELGIESVSIYSTADKDSLHVHLADYSICVGSSSPTESYLNMERILSAAVAMGVDAIHPGYGFLSENSKFAKMCEECNLIFIGPSADSIRQMGNKSTAREIMIENNIPVIPGSEGVVKDYSEALEIAQEIGYPVIIKASSGGGGKGMRIVTDQSELKNFIDQAKIEAENAFGDSSIYIEKYIINPRHIEFQIAADNFGNVIHLFERECSIQRRNQKLIEEAPSSLLSEEMRNKMGQMAVKAAKCIDYSSVGTIEFLVDSSGDYYFIEMNTRIQVEHPVTEMITGIDLIKLQIMISENKPLGINQEDLQILGHAIECRVNAEDTENNFMPCPGHISEMHTPGGFGIRVDTHIYHNYHMPIFYDSMLCKLIVMGKDRTEAISKMKAALDEFVISDIKHNISMQKYIISHKDFIDGNIDTGFIEKIQLG